MNKRRLNLKLIAIFATAALVLVSGSFAWFSSGSRLRVDNVNGSISNGAGMGAYFEAFDANHDGVPDKVGGEIEWHPMAGDVIKTQDLTPGESRFYRIHCEGREILNREIDIKVSDLSFADETLTQAQKDELLQKIYIVKHNQDSTKKSLYDIFADDTGDGVSVYGEWLNGIQNWNYDFDVIADPTLDNTFIGAGVSFHIEAVLSWHIT